MEGLIQLQNEQLLLTYLLSSAENEAASFNTKSVLVKALKELKQFIESMQKIKAGITYKGSLLLALERMKDPSRAKPTIHAAAPPGAPIGCEE